MNLSSFIDHTLLTSTADRNSIVQLCNEALLYNFAAVCVPPFYVSDARKLLRNSTVKTATVIGFPMGYSSVDAKMEEIKTAIDDGADELDMVINLCALKNQDWDYLSREITLCLQPVRLQRKVIKVIIESGMLSESEIVTCCQLYAKHKVDFMKTSTGYASEGARLNDVVIMKANLPEEIAIKASGGIRNFAFARDLIEAGASRLGTSSGISIVTESFC